VTSGTYSPILKKGIGFAFVNNDLAKDGTEL
jgi:aminomethyltransferase